MPQVIKAYLSLKWATRKLLLPPLSEIIRGQQLTPSIYSSDVHVGQSGFKGNFPGSNYPHPGFSLKIPTFHRLRLAWVQRLGWHPPETGLSFWKPQLARNYLFLFPLFTLTPSYPRIPRYTHGPTPVENNNKRYNLSLNVVFRERPCLNQKNSDAVYPQRLPIVISSLNVPYCLLENCLRSISPPYDSKLKNYSWN